MNFKPVLIHTSSDSIEDLKKLSQHLVENRLAACVTIKQDCTSVYRWQDKIETENEHCLEIKSSDDKQSAVQAAVNEFINYDCPQFIVTEVISMSDDYQLWYREMINE